MQSQQGDRIYTGVLHVRQSKQSLQTDMSSAADGPSRYREVTVLQTLDLLHTQVSRRSDPNTCWIQFDITQDGLFYPARPNLDNITAH